MFPNVRLMLVAMSASMLAIVCAISLFLGMFAAFSVAREPFSPLQPAKPPLQIALGGEASAPVIDGRPSPFGIRFQLNAPQAPNGPVIVAVPVGLDRAAPAEVTVEAPSNPQTSGQTGSQSNPQAPVGLPGASDTAVQAAPRDAPTPANQASKDDTAVAINAPSAATAPSVPSPAAAQPADMPRHVAPEIKIVAREADNPASVATAPAPALGRSKVVKHHKLVVHLRPSHHLRRPRVLPVASNPASVYAQPTGYAAQAGAANYAQPNGFMQPSFQAAPAAIKPRTVKLRRAAGTSSSADR
jgi:hypothetical protein